MRSDPPSQQCPDAGGAARNVASRPTLRRITVSAGAGLLLYASFPPVNWWFTAFIAFALLGWVLTGESISATSGFGYGVVFGAASYAALLPWVGALVGAAPWLALVVFCAVFPGMFGALATVVRGRPGWPLWLAGVWAGVEWLKSTVPFGGFPWGIVGFGQTSGPLLPLARLGGAPLLSFAVVLGGFSVTAIAVAIRRWRPPGRRSLSPFPAVELPGLCLCAIALGVAVISPDVQRSGAAVASDTAVTVAAVQGNVPRLGLDFNAQRRAVLDNHVSQTLRLAADVRAGRARQPHLVIWPENSSDIDPLRNRDAAHQIASAARAIGAPILVGAVLMHPDWTPDHPATTNTVIVWNPGGGPGDRHDKQIVLPFGEYLPWRSFFRHLSAYADRAGYFVPGHGSGVVHAAGVPVGVATCWEVVFDRAARESVLNGAQLLAVPTNNATFNATMSEQHLAFSKLRAVEHDRYVVVAGTTGISAVIAPDGRELARTRFFEPAYLDTQVGLNTTLTAATRWGPLLHLMLVGIGATALVLGWLQRGRRWPRRRRSLALTEQRGGEKYW
ncbi:apolipoprotein N-acyltransferase [Pseudomonas otitidis]